MRSTKNEILKLWKQTRDAVRNATNNEDKARVWDSYYKTLKRIENESEFKLPVFDTDILDWLERHAVYRAFYAEVKLFDDHGTTVIRLATSDHGELSDVESDVQRMVEYFDLDMKTVSYDDQSANTMFNGTYVYVHLYSESRTVTR